MTLHKDDMIIILCIWRPHETFDVGVLGPLHYTVTAFPHCFTPIVP